MTNEPTAQKWKWLMSLTTRFNGARCE